MKVSAYRAPDDDLVGAVAGLPAFQCHVTATGAWAFRCGCGQTHEHSAGEGHRAGRCRTHRPFGYWLVAPDDDQDQDQEPGPAPTAA